MIKTSDKVNINYLNMNNKKGQKICNMKINIDLPDLRKHVNNSFIDTLYSLNYKMIIPHGQKVIT